MSISAQQRTTWWSWTDETAPVSFYAPLKVAMKQALQELDKLDHVEGFGDSSNAKPSPQVSRDFSPVVQASSQNASGAAVINAPGMAVPTQGDALALAIASLADAIRTAGQPKKRGRPKKQALDKSSATV